MSTAPEASATRADNEDIDLLKGEVEILKSSNRRVSVVHKFLFVFVSLSLLCAPWAVGDSILNP